MVFTAMAIDPISARELCDENENEDAGTDDGATRVRSAINLEDVFAFGAVPLDAVVERVVVRDSDETKVDDDDDDDDDESEDDEADDEAQDDDTDSERA